ncbi:hypothetical protein [Cellulomonas sp. URHD0024]|uniref:hypothetical protein n=1 Tax=Cellulomonas sp. URHD0024 TaxID=1302620 RepID=UPI00041764E8|nr:hypothetical protein [Cellulomonas sp. URHD0024]
MRDDAHGSDARLRERGVVAGAPTQVRNHDGSGVATTDGPFLRSELPLAGVT